MAKNSRPIQQRDSWIVDDVTQQVVGVSINGVNKLSYLPQVPSAQAALTATVMLAQSAIPVILAPNGTVAADGTITLGTALPTTYATAWVYLPAGAVVGGAAGLYFATFSSTTVGSIKTNYVSAATAFTPYIPTGTIAAVGSGSAYTQTTGSDITLANITVPGGLMGANGALRFSGYLTGNNTATTTRNTSLKLGGFFMFSTGVLLAAGTGVNANIAARPNTEIRNRGDQAKQVVPHGAIAAGSGGVSAGQYATVNTALDTPLTFTGQLATATDYIVLEGFTVEVLPA